MDEAHRTCCAGTSENAWLNKIEGPSFKATGNEVAIECIELSIGLDIDFEAA